MKIIKYNTPVSDFAIYPRPWVFLAGPTVRGNQTHLISWRREAEEEFKKINFKGTLIVPEFTENTTSDKGKKWIPLWEFNGLMRSNKIIFWIPRTKELIGLTTNFEFGYWMAKYRNKILYGRPDDAYRIDYLDLMWVNDAAFFGGSQSSTKIYNSLSEIIKDCANPEIFE